MIRSRKSISIYTAICRSWSKIHNDFDGEKILTSLIGTILGRVSSINPLLGHVGFPGNLGVLILGPIRWF